MWGRGWPRDTSQGSRGTGFPKIQGHSCTAQHGSQGRKPRAQSNSGADSAKAPSQGPKSKPRPTLAPAQPGNPFARFPAALFQPRHPRRQSPVVSVHTRHRQSWHAPQRRAGLETSVNGSRIDWETIRPTCSGSAANPSTGRARVVLAVATGNAATYGRIPGWADIVRNSKCHAGLECHSTDDAQANHITRARNTPEHRRRCSPGPKPSTQPKSPVSRLVLS